MYYSNGSYEAFAHPRKPAGVNKKYAYIVGTGLAGLSAAVFLIRDAQMSGENIHIFFEELPMTGGSLDGQDRLDVVPEGSANLAFIDNFARIPNPRYRLYN